MFKDEEHVLKETDSDPLEDKCRTKKPVQTELLQAEKIIATINVAEGK